MLIDAEQRANRLKAPDPIGPMLMAVLKDFGLEKKLLEKQAAMLWKEIVDERLAQISSVSGVEGGKLFVYIEGSVWKDHFKYLKPVIIERINQRIGRTVIQDIVLARKRGE